MDFPSPVQVREVAPGRRVSIAAMPDAITGSTTRILQLSHETHPIPVLLKMLCPVAQQLPLPGKIRIHSLKRKYPAPVYSTRKRCDPGRIITGTCRSSGAVVPGRRKNWICLLTIHESGGKSARSEKPLYISPIQPVYRPPAASTGRVIQHPGMPLWYTGDHGPDSDGTTGLSRQHRRASIANLPDDKKGARENT